MASHEELIAEMPKLEKLSNAQRLKHAKKRRLKQLKKWQETERLLRQSSVQSMSIADASIRRSTRQRLVNFHEDAMLRDAINRNDAEEGTLNSHNLAIVCFSCSEALLGE